MSTQSIPDPDEEHAASIRTELAWSRSGLALLACFAIMARQVWSSGAERGDALALALVSVASFGWALSVGIGVRRSQKRNLTPRRPRELFVIALSTVAIGAAGVVITFVNS